MAFKSKGGFVIRPIITADSPGGVNASFATINSRLTELEAKVFPATIVSMTLVKLTDMTFDLTVVFSKKTRQLTGSDLELTSCTASNFRRPSDTTQVITLTATSSIQFSYKIKEDSVAGQFVGSSLQTKVADVYRESGRIDLAGANMDGNFQTSITTIGNPILFGFVRDARGAQDIVAYSGTYFSIYTVYSAYVNVGNGQVDGYGTFSNKGNLLNEPSNIVLASFGFSKSSGVPGQFLGYNTISAIEPLPAGLYGIEGYTETETVGNWRLVALTKVY